MSVKALFLIVSLCFLTSCINIENNIFINKNKKGDINICINVSRFLLEFGAFFRGKSYNKYLDDLKSNINFNYLDSKFGLKNAENTDLKFDNFQQDFDSKSNNIYLKYNFTSENGLSDALKIFGSNSYFSYKKKTNIVVLSIDLYSFYNTVLNISSNSSALLNFSNIKFNFHMPAQIECIKNKNFKATYANDVLKISANVSKLYRKTKILKFEIKLKG